MPQATVQRDVYEGIGDTIARFAKEWIVQTIGRGSATS
jgi:hypothetical protein